jgi:hypothetical protein
MVNRLRSRLPATTKYFIVHAAKSLHSGHRDSAALALRRSETPDQAEDIPYLSILDAALLNRYPPDWARYAPRVVVMVAAYRHLNRHRLEGIGQELGRG